MKKALACMLVVGFMATAANAVTLTMDFRGTTDREITVGPSDMLTIDFLATPDATPTVGDIGRQFDNVLFKLGISGLTNHFTVESWGLPAGDGGATWDGIGGAAPSEPLGQFLEEYANYGAAGDLLQDPITFADASPVLVFAIQLHVASADEGDITLVNLNDDLYPVFALGIAGWTEWPQATPPPAGLGGFYWTDVTPLVIHNIPEPASLALLAIGGLLVIRRR